MISRKPCRIVVSCRKIALFAIVGFGQVSGEYTPTQEELLAQWQSLATASIPGLDPASYFEVKQYADKMCGDAGRISLPCGECNEDWGGLEKCRAECNSKHECNYFTFLSDTSNHTSCSIHNTCPQTSTKTTPTKFSGTTYKKNVIEQTIYTETSENANRICENEGRINLPCGNCGPRWGGKDLCLAECDARPDCKYVNVFSDDSCRIFSSCHSTTPGLKGINNTVFVKSSMEGLLNSVGDLIEGKPSPSSYVVIPAYDEKICHEAGRIPLPCGDCGPKWGNLEKCMSECNSRPECNYLTYFNDGSCRIFNSCPKSGIQGGYWLKTETTYKKNVLDQVMYQEIPEYADQMCDERAKLKLPCGNCGPKWGSLDFCMAECDTLQECNYVTYSSDDTCRVYTTCPRTTLSPTTSGDVTYTTYIRSSWEHLFEVVDEDVKKHEEQQKAKGPGYHQHSVATLTGIVGHVLPHHCRLKPSFNHGVMEFSPYASPCCLPLVQLAHAGESCYYRVTEKHGRPANDTMGIDTIRLLCEEPTCHAEMDEIRGRMPTAADEDATGLCGLVHGSLAKSFKEHCDTAEATHKMQEDHHNAMENMWANNPELKKALEHPEVQKATKQLQEAFSDPQAMKKMMDHPDIQDMMKNPHKAIDKMKEGMKKLAEDPEIMKKLMGDHGDHETMKEQMSSLMDAMGDPEKMKDMMHKHMEGMGMDTSKLKELMDHSGDPEKMKKATEELMKSLGNGLGGLGGAGEKGAEEAKGDDHGDHEAMKDTMSNLMSALGDPEKMKDMMHKHMEGMGMDTSKLKELMDHAGDPEKMQKALPELMQSLGAGLGGLGGAGAKGAEEAKSSQEEEKTKEPKPKGLKIKSEKAATEKAKSSSDADPFHHPEFGNLMDPGNIMKMMGSPDMQAKMNNIMNDPEALLKQFADNPMMKGLVDKMPELKDAFSKPDEMKKAMEELKNLGMGGT